MNSSEIFSIIDSVKDTSLGLQFKAEMRQIDSGIRSLDDQIFLLKQQVLELKEEKLNLKTERDELSAKLQSMEADLVDKTKKLEEYIDAEKKSLGAKRWAEKVKRINSIYDPENSYKTP